VAVKNQEVTKDYAAYNGDCIEVMKDMPDKSIHLSVYSPPFAGLYNYSSDPRDLSNCLDKDQFFKHYDYVVEQISRLTLPGRMTAVHCADIPNSNSGTDTMYDLPGDIIRQHERLGWGFVGRYAIWKEPLEVRNRTYAKKLFHQAVVEDSSRCSCASADYLLIFRKEGTNKIPITHPNGLTSYAGERLPPGDVLKYRGWQGKQIENKYSHWIWRQYASSFWDDIRLKRVLPYQESRADDDERHVHPLQLDVIDRCVILWSNPGESVLTPFMGVGSEVYSSVSNNRKGIGIELKTSYYNQAVKNLKSACDNKLNEQETLLTS